MNLKKFLNLSAGKWFSQRTNYLLGGDKADSSKADITIEFISKDDERARKLCQKHNLNFERLMGGMVQSWDNSVDWGKDKQVGSATVIFVSDADDDCTGKIVRPQDSQVCGSYAFGKDEALTLTIDNEEMHAEERQWFAIDNFKMRTTMVRFHDGKKQTSFYSEIRKAPPKEESKSDS